jgi:hypothetical protein
MADLSQLTNLAGAGLILVIGVLFLAFAAGAFYFGRGRGARASGIMAIVGVLLIVVVAIPVALLATPSSGTVAPPAPPAASVSVLENSGTGLATGVTWNAVTDILSVDVGYNYTSHQYTVAAANTTPTGAAATFKQYSVTLPLSLIRTDALNSTYAFPVQVTSVPTFTTLTAPTTAYSFVGYSAATGSSTSAWQMAWSAGTTAGQKSTVNAPSVTTNVLPGSLAIPSFSSKSIALGITLAGANSTSAVAPWSASLTTFASFNMPVTIGDGTPALVTVQFIWTGYSNN